MAKLVTVIIPYLEDRGWLEQAVRSVHEQTYPHIELIPIHGSKNRAGNINDGLKKAKGDFIKLLDEDDWLPKRAIELSVKKFNGDFIHGNAHTVKGKKITPYIPKIKYPTFADVFKKNFVHGPTMMYAAGVYDKIGLYDEDIGTAEDWDFNLRALAAGLNLGYIDEFLVYYRRHDTQVSTGKGADKNRRAIDNQKVRDKWISLNNP